MTSTVAPTRSTTAVAAIPSGSATASVRPAGRPGTGPAGPAGRGHQPPGHAHRCVDPAQLVRGFAQLYLEVEAGWRPATQLAQVLDARLAARLRAVWVRPQPRPGRVIAVTGERVAGDRYEAVAVVRRGGRFGALGVQLRRRGGRWRVEMAARPEDGPLPEPPFPFPSDEPDAFDLVLPDAGPAGDVRAGAPQGVPVG
ncbi:hypothetical protein BH23ACT8_BH23ACT8_00210 [soil metagenome]